MNSCNLHCLKIENISVTFGENKILDNVSLHAHCGELTAIIGGNGAGKSTLLKAILGEIAHDGNISFSGHNKDEEILSPKIGYVPQSFSVDFSAPTTVFDFLHSYFSRYPVFFPRRKKDVQKIKKHLQLFGCAHLVDYQLGKLSGGELQRVLVSVAMMPKPDVLILDEPVSGVDQAGLKMFYDLIELLKKTHDIIIIMVSHDFGFVGKYADHVLLLSKGAHMIGDTKTVFSSDLFRSAFSATERGNA